MFVKTAAWFSGYVTMVRPWRLAECAPFVLYGEDFNSPYCLVEFHDAI